MQNNLWIKFTDQIRAKLVSLYDPTVLFAEDESLQKDLQISHKGFYIGIVSSDEKDLAHSGFLKEDLNDLRETAVIIIKNLYDELKIAGVTIEQIQTATFYFSLVKNCEYIPDPLSWDENKDGIYFQWGQKYKGMYLPYDIQRMNIPKIEIMDRLCSWVCGVPSSLWRLPEGLVFKLTCSNYMS